jgi:hypothetical protein
MMIKIFFFLLFALGFFPTCSYAQEPGTDSLNKSKGDSNSTWSFYAEADNYIFPTEPDILTLIATADKGIWHLEARYNYEDRNTASVFGGLNFTAGNKLQLVLTPMAGIVFGRLNGLAPGLETDLSYNIFNFNSQSEWVFDFSGKEGNFIYTYLQLGVSVTDHFGLGFTAQRTRLYQTSFDLQRGIFAQYSFWKLNTSLSYFNPFSTSYFFVAILSIDF